MIISLPRCPPLHELYSYMYADFNEVYEKLMRSINRLMMAILLTSLRQCLTNQLLNKGPE